MKKLLGAQGLSEDDSQRMVEQVIEDFESSSLSDADKAILRYSEKLTRNPETMQSADVEKLREVGLDDLAIHDLCAIVGYFAFVNRIADGLGVELEE